MTHLDTKFQIPKSPGSGKVFFFWSVSEWVIKIVLFEVISTPTNCKYVGQTDFEQWVGGSYV